METRFEINNTFWKIIEKDGTTLLDSFNSENEDKVNSVFGITSYSKHEIWINKDMCQDQKIKTLKHELTHCYIWNYGLYNVPRFNEEMVCDLVSSINDFINYAVALFKANIMINSNKKEENSVQSKLD